MPRVFIVHGWGGYPKEGWFPWLKEQLEAKGFEVHIPQMPQADEPRIFNWVPKITEAVGLPDEATYFVGHSMGCQTIARYLETLPDDQKIGGAVFVAGFFKRLTGLETPEEQEIGDHWLKAPLDLQKVRSHLPASVAIFSDNDPFVPLDNQTEFRQQLGAEIHVEHGKGHFSGPSDGLTQLPIALEAVMQLAQK